jgi:hypothetical protein
MGYPQLFPAIISLPYVFMGQAEIQFFSYAVALVCPPRAMLAAFSLYDRGYPGPALAAALVMFLWPMRRYYLNVGFVDAPVMTLGFLSLCALVWSAGERGRDTEKFITLSVVLAAAAAAAKQAGLLLLIFLPLMIGEFRRYSGLKPVRGMGRLAVNLLAALVIALPWHVYTQYQIQVGECHSVTPYVTEGIHQGRNLLERLIVAMRRWPTIFIFAALALPGLSSPGHRSVSAFALLGSLVWALWFSYDSRNVYLFIPFAAFSLGLTLQRVVRWRRFEFSLRTTMVKSLALVVSGLLLVAALVWSSPIEQRLMARQKEKLLELEGRKELNSLIVELAMDERAVFITDAALLPFVDKSLPPKIIMFDPRHRNLSEAGAELRALLAGLAGKKIYLYFELEFVRPLLAVTGGNVTLLGGDWYWLYQYSE